MPHSQKREVQVQVCLTPVPKNFVRKLLKTVKPSEITSRVPGVGSGPEAPPPRPCLGTCM